MALAQLAVFVRPPTVGSVKTRLTAVLGASGAVGLYRAFVEDTIRLCSRVRAAGRIDVALWSAGPSADQTVSEWARRLGTSARVQPEGDLGVKLSTAFAEGLQRYERVVVIGSDAPTLPIDLIVAAFDSLDNAPIVLGPANDGGYYAVGATRRVRPRFDGVRWSSPSALEDTIAANAPHRVAVTPPWYDVDDPTDLAILRVHLSVDPGAAPATARFLGGASLKDRAS
jgi:rSAM/selenodomain-associated transferase 1